MKNKIIIALLAVIALLLGFIAFKFYGLEQKVSALENQQSENVSITPVNPNDNSAADADNSNPFDAPHQDPLGNQFPEKTPTPPPLTKIAFATAKHDFGRIKEGETVHTTFRFTNTGKNPLILSNVAGSCGCTVPRWTKSVIPPGEDGKIDVSFDSSGKPGEQTKTVTVSANTQPPVTELVIKATVIPQDK